MVDLKLDSVSLGYCTGYCVVPVSVSVLQRGPGMLVSGDWAQSRVSCVGFRVVSVSVARHVYYR